MIQKEIKEDIKKIKEPVLRILLYCLMAAVITLFWMYESKDNSLKSTYGKNEIECDSVKRVYEVKLDLKQNIIDSMKTQQINDLKKAIEIQRSLNKTLKSKLK